MAKTNKKGWKLVSQVRSSGKNKGVRQNGNLHIASKKIKFSWTDWESVNETCITISHKIDKMTE